VLIDVEDPLGARVETRCRAGQFAGHHRRRLSRRNFGRCDQH
jgi:hypothetical protein